MTSQRSIAIVGGGITGLTAAYRLSRWAATRGVQIRLFERQDRLGGIIQTDTRAGVVLEGGPDSFLRRKVDIIDLCRDLEIDRRLIGTNPAVRGAYIFHRGRLHPIPDGLQAGIPARIGPLAASTLLDPWGKLRAAGDLVLPRRVHTDEDVSIGSLLRYRFGDQVVERLAAPILSGIYAGDIDALSLRATFPDLWDTAAASRSLILAARSRRAPPADPGASPFVTLADGIASLIQALAASLTPVDIRLNTPVMAIRPDAGGYWVDAGENAGMRADAVVLAVPAHQAAALVAFAGDEMAGVLNTIPYANLAVVGMVYPASSLSRSLDKTGFLVPKTEGLAMTACTWVSAKWRYPDAADKLVLRIFYGRADGPDVLDWTDTEFIARARADLSTTMGLTAEPEYARIFRLPRSMPQYTTGHLDRMAHLDSLVAKWPGLYLAGAAYYGVGVPDCVRQANRVADRIKTELSGGCSG